jgi:hypothetical protein
VHKLTEETNLNPTSDSYQEQSVARKTSIGGQALIEGLMMLGPD